MLRTLWCESFSLIALLRKRGGAYNWFWSERERERKKTIGSTSGARATYKIKNKTFFRFCYQVKDPKIYEKQWINCLRNRRNLRFNNIIQVEVSFCLWSTGLEIVVSPPPHSPKFSWILSNFLPKLHWDILYDPFWIIYRQSPTFLSLTKNLI